MIDIVAGAILGTITSAVIAHLYYHRSTRDLDAQVDELRKDITSLESMSRELQRKPTRLRQIQKSQRGTWSLGHRMIPSIHTSSGETAEANGTLSQRFPAPFAACAILFVERRVRMTGCKNCGEGIHDGQDLCEACRPKFKDQAVGTPNLARAHAPEQQSAPKRDHLAACKNCGDWVPYGQHLCDVCFRELQANED